MNRSTEAWLRIGDLERKLEAAERVGHDQAAELVELRSIVAAYRLRDHIRAEDTRRAHLPGASVGATRDSDGGQGTAPRRYTFTLRPLEAAAVGAVLGAGLVWCIDAAAWLAARLIAGGLG